MKKGLFTGWQDVFSFTFARQTEGKYRTLTMILSVLFFAGAFAISTIMAAVQKKDDAVVEVEKVYLIDDSGLEMIYLDGFLESYAKQFPQLTFESTEESIEELATALSKQETKDVILHLEKKDAGYLMTVVLPEGGRIKKKDAEKLADGLELVMEQSKLLSSQIPMDKLVYAMSGVTASLHIAGEDDKSIGEELMQKMGPMLISFLMFFFCFTYGSSVGNIVSIEKTSKLMEMILTHTRPYPLILGKVMAVTVSAILQICLWVASFLVGFVAGDLVAKEMIYPEYNNVLLEVINLLKTTDGSSAFSAGAIVLGGLCMFIGFLFFCMVAATVASFASKAEELSQVMAVFMLISMAAFYGAYILPIMVENDTVNLILRLIPFTGAFLTPGDIFVGNISLTEGLLETLLLLSFCLAATLIAGKTYKGMVLNNGRNVFAKFFAKKEKARV